MKIIGLFGDIALKINYMNLKRKVHIGKTITYKTASRREKTGKIQGVYYELYDISEHYKRETLVAVLEDQRKIRFINEFNIKLETGEGESFERYHIYKIKIY